MSYTSYKEAKSYALGIQPFHVLSLYLHSSLLLSSFLPTNHFSYKPRLIEDYHLFKAQATL